MIIIQSNYFGDLEITGKQEQSAAEWLTIELKDATKTKEILSIKEANELFNAHIYVTNSHVKDTDRTLHSLL